MSLYGIRGPRHGTLQRYAKGKCRCDECKAANTAYSRKLRAERESRTTVLVPHGTAKRYLHYNCRCDDCTAAATELQRQKRSAARDAS